jgi:S-formylglutathione hydrolase FrmB
VLYLLHGAFYNENTWLRHTDLEQFTAPFAGERAAIVVMPDGGPMGFYADWHDGDQQWETYHLRRLVPYIDERFRTRPDRSQRAIAGFSLGGFGALHYAARHPDLFVAAGSFSGLTHLTFPEDPYQPAAPQPSRDAGAPGTPRDEAPAQPYRPPTDEGSGCGRQDGSAFGDRVDDATVWHAHNPTDIAPNLHPVSVYAAAGSGVACAVEDAAAEPSFAVGLEPGARRMTEAFVGALRAAGVDHVADLRDCGLHDQATAERSLHAFWPVMLRAFGRTAPAEFRFRTADPDASVWGWSFLADTRRAMEFLDVRDASAAGLTLTGSGSQTVVTAPFFRPRQRVTVGGAEPRVARAGEDGRLPVAVDLGRAHDRPQFQPGGAPPAFVTRRVTFAPRPALPPSYRPCGRAGTSRSRGAQRRLRWCRRQRGRHE